VFEPGFYFPELDESSDLGTFPQAVHLAWEYDHERTDGTVERRIRRLSWWLDDLTATRSTVVAGEPVWVDADGYVAAVPKLWPGEYVTPEGQILRRYPWQPTGTPGSPRTCMFSDGSWPLSDVQDGKVNALSSDRATWHQRPIDLGVDFLPVVHVPNTVSSGEHYGRSAIDLVAQILDDVAQVDTDTMKASRFLGEPTIALSGASLPEASLVAPGQVYGLGEKGQMDVLDLAGGLAALMAHGDRLLDRYWVNGRVPREMIGRVDASEAASGLALLLTFAPFAQVVGIARMVRSPKYDLVLKMAQRIAMVYGAIDPGPLPPARFAFGSYLPTNRDEVVGLVTKALGAHAISTQTAVSILVAAGLPIDDAKAELDRIRSDDAEGAKAVADATGSEALAAERLGLTLPTAPPAPTLELNLPDA
jgi:hypothetical protein